MFQAEFSTGVKREKRDHAMYECSAPFCILGSSTLYRRLAKHLKFKPLPGEWMVSIGYNPLVYQVARDGCRSRSNI